MPLSSVPLSSVLLSSVLLSGTLLSSACAMPHVVLPAAPAATAPRSEREAYYHAHGPRLLKAPPATQLEMRDGSRVVDPRDLLAVVPADSTTGRYVARFARRYEDVGARAHWLWIGAGTGLAVEAVAGIAAAVAAAAEPNNGNGLSPTVSVLLGVSVVGAVGGITSAMLAAADIEALQMLALEHDTALASYDQTLRAQLALDESPASSSAAPPTLPALPTVPALPALTALTTAAPLTQASSSPPTARLTLSPLPATCGSADALHDGVRARLGRDPFVKDGDDHIDISVVQGEPTTVDGDAPIALTLTLTHGADVIGARTLVGTTHRCSEIVQRAALLLAVLLDPPAPPRAMTMPSTSPVSSTNAGATP